MNDTVYGSTIVLTLVLLYDHSTAEAVLQEMDNINIRRNRRSGEVERLRMWTDTEFVSILTLTTFAVFNFY